MPLFDSVDDRRALNRLADKILKTIHQDVMLMNTESGGSRMGGADVIRRNWSICSTASKKLKAFRAKYDQFVVQYDSLTDGLAESFGEFGYKGKINLIRDLKSGCFVVELKSSSKIIPTLIKELRLEHIEKTKTSVKILDSSWTKLGEQLVLLEQQIQIEESLILKALKQKITSKSAEFIQLSSIIEQLDIAQSFASLAREKNLVCPKVDNSSKFEIVEGRHLVVEKGLQNHNNHSHHTHHDSDYTVTRTKNFTPNSCTLTPTHPHVITGPNMGGKSTFLRQNATIAILAQIGSYVPATSAHIGIIDRIFTRVGSSDSIYHNESTFMVEMKETSEILKNATPRSLVLIDELGRGTAGLEGVSVAYACLWRLCSLNQCKVLFATHFGMELERLICGGDNADVREEKGNGLNVKFFHTEMVPVKDGNGDDVMVINHRLKSGISYYSHAVDIAKLAGFPQDTLDLAKDTYAKLCKENGIDTKLGK
ncbi:unnamed protein product [Ambrosiozyma monospora]|uniref:Unnamed protein product n=1 Tax=Ambrosiozyma monospora TaxID=43982 RepID=A0A9W7DK56_AMBMO|nr:unnamed protein product [Ambrosiozyma monospora]